MGGGVRFCGGKTLTKKALPPLLSVGSFLGRGNKRGFHLLKRLARASLLLNSGKNRFHFVPSFLGLCLNVLVEG